MAKKPTAKKAVLPPVPVPVPVPKPKRTRAPKSEASMERARQRAKDNKIFNSYLMPSKGAVSASTQQKRIDKLAQIDANLASGTVVRRVPVYSATNTETATNKNGLTYTKASREKNADGSAKMKDKVVALKPHEKVFLYRERAELIAKMKKGAGQKDDNIRAGFLAMLPRYAETNRLENVDLVSIGVSMEDLIDAGMCEPEALVSPAIEPPPA